MSDVYVISHGRSANVTKMLDQLGDLDSTWVVGEGENEQYQAAGARNVICGGGLCPSRNAAMDHARSCGSRYCVQTSDDLRAVRVATGPNKARSSSLGEALEMMRGRLLDSTYYLAGVAPTANAFYYTGKPVATAAFIVGDLCMIDLRSDIRWDERLRLKEDYDFTAAHLMRYGGVVRCNDILAEYAHRSNAGGAVSYRTPEREQEAIALLKRKWGAIIRDNPRRKDEVLFRLPKRVSL